MATGISFSLGSATVSIDNEGVSGYTRRYRKDQVLGRTAGNTVYVYDKGITRRILEVQLLGLSLGEKTDLENFFENNSVGMENTFTYTDEAQNSYTARFVVGELPWEKLGPDLWSVNFTLEITV